MRLTPMQYHKHYTSSVVWCENTGMCVAHSAVVWCVVCSSCFALSLSAAAARYLLGRKGIKVRKVLPPRGTPYIINYNKYITSITLTSLAARARKRNKTKSLIIFKNRGHI